MELEVDLKQDAFEAATNFAASQNVSLSEAVNELIKLAGKRITYVDGVAAFDLPRSEARGELK